MFWFDWMTLAIILGVAILQVISGSKTGGFGQPLFQALLICLAAMTAANLAGPLALSVHMQKSVVMLGLFVVLGVGAFFLGRLLHSVTGWSFGAFDGFMNFIFGAITGWAIAYMALRIIIESQGTGGPVAQSLAQAPVASEVYWFTTWGRIMALLFDAKTSDRRMWNINE
jgi:hypothetical protein